MSISKKFRKRFREEQETEICTWSWGERIRN